MFNGCYTFMRCKVARNVGCGNGVYKTEMRCERTDGKNGLTKQKTKKGEVNFFMFLLLLYLSGKMVDLVPNRNKILKP